MIEGFGLRDPLEFRVKEAFHVPPNDHLRPLQGSVCGEHPRHAYRRPNEKKKVDPVEYGQGAPCHGRSDGVGRDADPKRGAIDKPKV